ncbi:MAG: hypothetical protein Tsb0020_29470 [Haliangiales bacterium]
MHRGLLVAMAVSLCACGRVGYEANDGPLVDASAGPADAHPPQIDAGAPTPDAGAPALVARYLVDPDNPGRNEKGGADGTCEPCPVAVDEPAPGVSFEFTGEERIDIPYDPRFDGSGGFTVSLWLKQRSYSEYMTPITKPFGAQNGNSWKINASDTELVFESFFAGEIQYLPSPAGPLPLSAWKHVAVTWDGESKSLYRDGRLEASTAADIDIDASPIHIGCDIDFELPVYCFDGMLSDVRIYNAALSAAELAKLAAEFAP